MGSIVRVLFTVQDKNLRKDLGLITDNERRDYINKEIETLKENLSSYCSDQIEYFKDREPDISPESLEFILGSERPDVLIEQVKVWNANILDRLYTSVKV